MNSWLLMRRLRGPAFLIMVGFTALLNQWGVLSFSRSWPLYLILAGVFGLAERAALAAGPPVYPDPSAGYMPPPYNAAPYSAAPSPTSQPAQDPHFDRPLADPDRRS